MNYSLTNSKISDEDITIKLEKIIDFNSFELKKEYDIDIDFYNDDLNSYRLNSDVSYEIKKYHIVFVRALRDLFFNHGVNINIIKINGAISGILNGEINIFINQSKYQNYKRNEIIPCKEMFLYEDSKKTLDFMLQTNQISEEEYENNIDILQEELNIDEIEEENSYLN